MPHSASVLDDCTGQTHTHTQCAPLMDFEPSHSKIMDVSKGVLWIYKGIGEFSHMQQLVISNPGAVSPLNVIQ